MRAAVGWLLEAASKIKADRRIICLNDFSRSLLYQVSVGFQKHRRTISVIGSIALHLLVILAFLLPKSSGFASIGTTGEGTVNGSGFAISLIAAKDITKPATESTSSPSDPPQTNDQERPPETHPPLAEADTQTPVTPPEKPKPVAPPSETEKSTTTTTQTAQSGAGVTGQNGKAIGDLWSAIAPCWNRIADKDTLPATLKVSFSATGSLSVPPVIERDPSAPITDQTLRSEAKAIAALAQCGAYAMAQGQENVEVKFPKPN